MGIQRWLATLGRAVRAAWLLGGALLAVLLALEVGYRGQASLRRAIEGRGAGETPYPEAGYAWFDSIKAVHARRVELVWRPYIEFVEAPERSRYWNVDSLGHRRTIQTAARGTQRRDLFLFGGSSMLGTYLRDSATIPSRVAAELAARGIGDVAVTNFGQTGYTLAQEAIELLLALRAGSRPAAVVFFDGGNDVGAAVESGRAGAPRHEDDRARDWDAGRTLFTWRTDVASETRALWLLGRIAAGRLQLLDRFAPSPAAAALPAEDVLAEDVAGAYLGTVGWVEALARRYGFAAYYIWEPLLGSVEKPLSSYEQGVVASLRQTKVGRKTLDVRALVPPKLDARANRLVPGRFADFSGVFAGDNTTEFSNDAHATEQGSARIATELARRIAPLLGAARRTASAGSGRY